MINWTTPGQKPPQASAAGFAGGPKDCPTRDNLPNWAEAMLAQPVDGNRSVQCFRTVAALVWLGVDDPTIHRLLANHAPSVAKYGDRLGAEVDRILEKLS
jgi:hypothetical protein